MGQILAIVSSKGGVGKTTTALNLAAAFASLNFPTLLVEADPQCGLVANFGFDRFDIPHGLYDAVRAAVKLEDHTYETPVDGLHVVSSNVWSQEEEAGYVGAIARDPLALRSALGGLRDAYDYVVIDAPPMLGPVTLSILAAADRFLVPVQSEPQSVRVLGRLIETAGKVRERLNPKLRFDGIALTMVDERTRMAQALVERVRAEWPDQVFRNTIPRSVRLAEVPLSGRPLVVAAPASRGGRAYAALAEEILVQHARERALATAMEGEDEPAEPAFGGPGPESTTAHGVADGDGRGERTERTEARAGLGLATGTATELPDLTSLGLPAEDEWDERFVDLETYLEMESGGGPKTAVADDWDEGDDAWESWEREDA
jgi:chromosome partitioning protein